MDYTLMYDLETELEANRLTLAEFILELADRVFNGLQDKHLHEYLIDYGYVSSVQQLPAATAK
jgi:hypothetical protein